MKTMLNFCNFTTSKPKSKTVSEYNSPAPCCGHTTNDGESILSAIFELISAQNTKSLVVNTGEYIVFSVMAGVTGV